MAAGSTGQWFGMFCGDDVSLPNRISVAAATLARHPTVRGYCANTFVEEAGRERPGRPPEASWVWHGTDALGPKVAINGCSAFWHRDLFDEPLPRCNLDDYLLSWCAIIRWRGEPEEILMTDLTRVTVRYTVGTGITTAPFQGCHGMSRLRSAARFYAAQWKRDRLAMPVWSAIQAYDLRRGHDATVRGVIEGGVIGARMVSAGWWGRLAVLWRFHVSERHNAYGGTRKEKAKGLHRKFLERLFGCPGFVALTGLRALRRRLRRR